jgi:predicted patatin/cPLA2 family phospholipase
MESPAPRSQRTLANPLKERKKRALILEGGGMRSSYIAGALLALHERNIRDFDLVVGTSAGACCAANFLVGRPEHNRFVLEERLTSRRFINFLKVPTTRNVMDIDYLVDECFEAIDEMEKKLKNMSTKFLITVTNIETGETLYLDAARENLKELLRATCAMPYFYRRKLYRDGQRIMDGGLSTSIPIHPALEAGCDEVFVVCSRPEGYRKKPSRLGWVNRLFFPRYPHIARHLEYRHQHYNKELDLVENPPPGVRIIAIRPKGSLPVGRVTRDKKKVRAGVDQGYREAMQVLDKWESAR